MVSPVQKKLLGTTAFLAIIATVFFSTSSTVKAQFIANGSNLIFDGIVASTGSQMVIVSTDGTNPITLTVTKSTLVVPPNGTITVGDTVHVLADRTGSTITARIIRDSGNQGSYGTSGTPVLVNRGSVTGKTASTLTVNNGGVTVTFQITASTRFINTSLGSLANGQHVLVIGRDTGSAFVATLVIAQP